MTIAIALTQSFFLQKYFFFVIKCKFCRLLFWMGPSNTKGASMEPFLTGLQESRPHGANAPWGLAFAAM